MGKSMGSIHPRERRRVRRLAAPAVWLVIAIAVATVVGVGAPAAADTALTFTPTADSDVQSTSPDKNFGSDTTMRNRATSPEWRIYLKFTVTGVTGAVTSAKLRLYVTDPSADGGSVFPVSNQYASSQTDWTETGITWNTAPPISGSPLANAGTTTTGTWVELDVTPAISGDGTYSFGMTTTSSNSAYYSTKEGTNAPQLVVTDSGVATAPVNSTPPSISGTPEVGQTLTADPGVWSGTAPISYTYEWQRCNPACADIGGPTSQYTLVDADEGATIEVAVTAHNAATPPDPSATSDQVGPVTQAPPPTPPTNTVPPSITGTPQVGQTLTADPGVWTGTTPITNTYQWQQCNPTCTDIGNATAQTYPVAPGDIGTNIAVVVSAQNAATPDPPYPSATSSQVGPITDSAGQSVTVMAAGDIACSPTSSSFKGGLGTTNACHQKYTSDLVVAGNPDGVLALGDLQYENATLSEFQGSYDPSWGRFKAKTYPATGNHEYQTSGAAGYFAYWGAQGHQESKGYYSFDLGSWHFIALNSNCSDAGGCGAGSPQETWLRADLAAHPTTCTLAYWHHPRFYSTSKGLKSSATTQALWQALYDYHADIVLNGHVHHYERWAPQTPAGAADPSGIREFLVGTGGEDLTSTTTGPTKNLEIGSKAAFGVLRLVLRSTGYDWQFLPEAGKTFTDQGSSNCH